MIDTDESTHEKRRIFKEDTVGWERIYFLLYCPSVAFYEESPRTGRGFKQRSLRGKVSLCCFLFFLFRRSFSILLNLFSIVVCLNLFAHGPWQLAVVASSRTCVCCNDTIITVMRWLLFAVGCCWRVAAANEAALSGL